MYKDALKCQKKRGNFDNGFSTSLSVPRTRLENKNQTSNKKLLYLNPFDIREIGGVEAPPSQHLLSLGLSELFIDNEL